MHDKLLSSDAFDVIDLIWEAEGRIWGMSNQDGWVRHKGRSGKSRVAFSPSWMNMIGYKMSVLGRQGLNLVNSDWFDRRRGVL